MNPAVLDACFVAKLVFDESSSRRARTRLDEIARTVTPMHAPELLHAEMVAIASKKVSEGQATPGQAVELMGLPSRLGIVTWTMETLSCLALEITLAMNVSPYDAMYVALAEVVDGQLLTADRKLARVLAGSPLERRVELLGND